MSNTVSAKKYIRSLEAHIEKLEVRVADMTNDLNNPALALECLVAVRKECYKTLGKFEQLSGVSVGAAFTTGFIVNGVINVDNIRHNLVFILPLEHAGDDTKRREWIESFLEEKAKEIKQKEECKMKKKKWYDAKT